MLTLTFSRCFVFCFALVAFNVVHALPITSSRRATVIPDGPKFVVYTDAGIGNGDALPLLDQIQGFNVVNLAFLLSDGPHDQVQIWENLDSQTRQGLKQQYNDAGVSLVVSAFGQTELPTTAGLDPTALANQMAQFVLSTDLDGIDVDWEEFDLVSDKPSVGEQWLATFTQTLRGQLPKGQFILTHAPIGPWFQPALCPGGCYLTVDQTVGSLIDWYNIQFYNQVPGPGYEDCNTLVNSAGGSAIFEIVKSGVDISKLVIGKPGASSDADSGFIDPETWGTCIQQAVQQGWNAGVMAFEFPGANADWITAVKGASFA